MNRDEIISFVYTDPEKRLERFCKKVTHGQARSDWEELQSIVIEALCKLPNNQVEDLWIQKDGYRSRALWIWLYNAAKRQAHGNRTQYQKIVLKPREVNCDDDFFDVPIDHEETIERQAYEERLHEAHNKFEERIQDFSRLQRIVLESYLKGGMNAAQICREAGLSKRYYYARIEEIKAVLEECVGLRPSKPKELEPPIQQPAFSQCLNLVYLARTCKKPKDVHHWNRVVASFKARERKKYPQPTLFPIREYLPPLYRKISIA